MKFFFVFFCLALSSVFAMNLDAVKSALAKEFQNNFPNIIIKDIQLKANALPKDFENYTFLRIAPGNFTKAQGFLRAEFKSPKSIQRNVFFRFFIQANLEILRAKHSINRGDKLGSLDYELVLMDFDKVPLNALFLDDVKELVAKTRINKNAILKENMFKTKALIKKNDNIIGILKDENVNISIELVALESANLNERIRVKNKEGRILQGKVIAKDKVLLQ